MNKQLNKLVGGTIATLLVVFLGYLSKSVYSANLTSVSDVLTTVATSASANHTIQFTLDAGNSLAAGETVVITFPGSSFDTTTLSSSDPIDYDIVVGATDETVVANGGCGVTDAIEVTSITATTITFTACPSYTAGSNGAVIVVEIGTNATAGGTGNSQIINPSGAGTYVVTLAAGGDNGALAIDILTTDQITITAAVDPIMDVTISSTTCTLGTLSNSQVDTCQYNVSVSTNAANGYTGTLKDDGNLRTSGIDDINDAGGDNDVDAGNEEYGVATSKVGQTIVQYTTCTDPASNPQPASAITTSAQQFSSATGPVNSDATTLCHAASVAGNTPAGLYSHVVTIVVTATF